MKPLRQDRIQAGEVLRHQNIPTATPELGVHPPQAPQRTKILAGQFTSVGGDCQETVEEEEGNDILDTVKALSGFSLKEEVLEVEQAAPAAEEALAQAAAAEEVLD